MNTTLSTSWERFCQLFYYHAGLDIALDVSRTSLSQEFLDRIKSAWDKAVLDMKALESGAIANPDENRMVGHYWLRAPQLAPNKDIRAEIELTLERIKKFAARIHEEKRFTDVLSIGIGGSALGPMFVHDALGTAQDKMRMHFFDNTDPDGMDRTLRALGGNLKNTLIVVISKSGGTPETFNGMIEAQNACKKAGLDFAKQAVAVTGADSKLDKLAASEGWLDRFPMWDWVGGRTSELSAVGLLDAALQGIDIQAMLDGAAEMDVLTRDPELQNNPGGLLALAWYSATGGKGAKDMVILPYKDRLALFSRYLQQLVMESLGKKDDLKGQEVHQGIAVYGNKGSTDQHAYVQQLRDGLNNFFATFLVVESDRAGDSIEVSPGATTGDFLSGMWQGTRQALTEGGRESILITVPDVSPRTVGALIALYERAVGFYGFLVNINAYHQPGVEAGKKAAAAVLKLQDEIVKALGSVAQNAEAVAAKVKSTDIESVFHICRHLAANKRFGVRSEGQGLQSMFAKA